MVVVTSSQRDVIFDAVRAMYSEVAQHPERGFHFPIGRSACLTLGYGPELLDRLPPEAVASFAGVGYPFAADVIREGDTVLDIGSGSGTDVFIAARLVGPTGRVIGLDMTAPMREKLLAHARAMGLAQVEVVDGNAERIPLPDACVDVVTSNGVLNLVPDKPAAFAELARVLRPGGRLQLSDIVVGTLPSAACRNESKLWAECIVGATTDEDYRQMLATAGLRRIEVLVKCDYFSHSASPETRKVAAGFGAHAITLRAVKESK